MTEAYDAIIVGAGQAGPPLAGRLSAAGMSVAIIERKLFGGTCVNTGCIPTKALVASAYAAHWPAARRSMGSPRRRRRVDMKAVKARKDGISTRARTGVETWLAGMEHCTFTAAMRAFSRRARSEWATIASPRSASSSMSAAARSFRTCPGIDQVPYLTNSSILALDTLPRHLVIVGGSYIGLEFAQMYRRFGSDVTVVEKARRLIPREDEDVSAAIKDILEGEGIDVRLDAECIRFEQRGAEVGVGVDCTGGAGNPWLACPAGRSGGGPTPTISGSTRAGVKIDERGYIMVDDELGRARPGSGRSATATAAAPSPIPPTTTSRSSPPISSTASRAASATAFPPMRFTSIRRSAASA